MNNVPIKRLLRRGCWLPVVVIMAGCATVPAPEPIAEEATSEETPRVEVTVDETAMLPLLGYLQLLPRMSTQELARERVARKHGLADEDLELLSGDEEQMERLAARLAAVAPPANPGAPKAPPVPGIGRVPETRNIPLADQIAAAEKAGDKALVATLKAMQLTASPQS